MEIFGFTLPRLFFELPHWMYWGGLATIPLVFMALHQWAIRKPETVDDKVSHLHTAIESDPNPSGHLERAAEGNIVTKIIDQISGFTGLFVAYWSVIAVVVYFYEVLARYFFNSPTNWAHESMFLMFGMQYILAGAYAYRFDAHVRVDLFYARATIRGKAALDILTSTAFFTFICAFTWTSWTFFADSMDRNEFWWASGYANQVSFTEWAVAYYPVKFMLVLGGGLLMLQGVSRLIKDVQVFRAAWLDGNIPRRSDLADGSVAARKPHPLAGGFLPSTPTGWLVAGVLLLLATLLAVEFVNVGLFDPNIFRAEDQQIFLWTLQGSLRGIDIGLLSILMFGSLMVLLALGLPLVFVTGSLGVLFIYLVGQDTLVLNIIPSRIFPLMTSYDLSAIPLFIFMASMLERAGLIDEMFDVIYKWMGGFPGGLAAATIVASTILAAMVGVIGAAVVTMGLIALPAMLRRNYDPKIALGSIMAGGTLGILIPPSILAIIYSVTAGSLAPGLMLSGLYIFYVATRSAINPKLGPPLPREERVSLAEKLGLLARMIAPVLLIVLVLGVIFTGAATPVEAAGIGSAGAMVVAALHKRLTIINLRDACVQTMRASAMVLWIIFGATIFVGFYIREGGAEFVKDLILGTGLGPYGVLLLMMVLLVFLGMFLDWVGILLLAVPIFLPIVAALEFTGLFGLPGVPPDEAALWFGVLYLVNMQMSFLSPPFGYALFYMRGVTPKKISTATIFKAALPFLGLQVVGLGICIIFPDVVLWLPRLVYGG